MFKFFEQLGLRAEDGKQPEKKDLLSAEVIKNLEQEVVMGHKLALINHEAPAELKELAVAKVRANGYTVAVPWQGFKSQLFCRPEDQTELIKAQELGETIMTLKQAAVSPEILALLIRPDNLHGYSYDQDHNLQLLAERKPFIVFDKID